MKRPIFCAIAFAVLMPLAGCSYVKTPYVAFSDDGAYLPGRAGQGLVVSANSKIPDVPMPIGFSAVPSRSSSSAATNNQARFVRHVYQGRANQGEAAAFYRRVLPENNWTPVDIQSVGSSTVMRYTKGAERLQVTTEQSWGVTTIQIDIDGQ